MKDIIIMAVCLFLIIVSIYDIYSKEKAKEQNTFPVKVISTTDTINTDTVIVIPCDKKLKYVKIIIKGTKE